MTPTARARSVKPLALLIFAASLTACATQPPPLIVRPPAPPAPPAELMQPEDSAPFSSKVENWLKKAEETLRGWPTR